MNMIAQLQDHRKKADAMYDRWKWKHSHCLQPYYEASPPSPSPIEPQDESHTASGDASSGDTKHTDASSNKRKSEIPHDDGQPCNSKARRLALEQSATASLVRPSANA